MNNSGIPEFLSCEQVRAVDRYAIEKIGLSGLVLMENAARGCTDLLERQGITGGVVAVCGKGNNGGDGLAIVRHLLIRKRAAKAVLMAQPDELQGDALANFEILQRVSPESLVILGDSVDKIDEHLHAVGESPTEWVVDAVLGTGTRGQIREPFASLIDRINAASARVLAVDIPSGLDGDSGESLGHTIRAELTGTFVAQKQGFAAATARAFTGEVHVLDIGVPDAVIQRAIS